MYWYRKQWDKRNSYENKMFGRDLSFSWLEFKNKYPLATRMIKIDRYGPGTIDNFASSLEEYEIAIVKASGWTCYRCRKLKPKAKYRKTESSKRGTGYTCKDCYDWSKGVGRKSENSDLRAIEWGIRAKRVLSSVLG